MFTKFCTQPPGCYTGEILFANASKVMTNWFLTLQPNILKIICNLPKWAQERAWMYFICLCTFVFWTCVKERKASLKFQH